MKRKNATRNALVASILALLVCVSMLVGATFAWFTDEVTTGMNTIAAGNLDVKLLADGIEVDSETMLFDDVTLWEPGVVVYENLQVANAGTLALQYQMALNFGDENYLEDTEGNQYKLSDVLKVAVLDQTIDTSTMDRVKVLGLAKAAGSTDLSEFALEGELEAKTDGPAFAVVIFWEPNSNEIDNRYNVNNGKTVSDYEETKENSLHIKFGVNLQAYQKMSESDSFGPDYDEYAAHTVRVKNVDELIAILTEIKNDAKQNIPGTEGNKNYRVKVNIVLDGDIEVADSAKFMYTDSNGAPFHFYGVEGVLDLNGHNITVGSDALMAGKDYANAALLFQYSNVDIVGEGNIVTQNKSIPIYGWANGSVNIYGGNYITNASERNESAVYVNSSSMIINVYGGTYENSAYAFNAHDTSANAPVIVLHEGVTYKDFLKNGTTNVIANDINNGRIVLAEGCKLNESVIEGETWYTVVPNTVATAEELLAALAKGGTIIFANDIALEQAVTVNKPVTLNLNNHTLTTMGLDFAANATIENGTIASGGNTSLTPHLKATAGTLTMNNVTVDVNHHLNANANWSEATGMEVQNAKAVLNNCNVKINNVTKAQWVYSYGISLNNAEITVNGGSITAECVAGTAANGPTNPNAISTMGECTATLNNVNVTATYYVTTVNGHATVNTTDKGITSANIVDNRGGSHTLNYID